MDELKPCLDKFMNDLKNCDTVKVILTGVGETTYATKEIYQAVSSELNRRAAPENKPLTLERLRKMGGEPVWCEYINLQGEHRNGIWCICHTIYGNIQPMDGYAEGGTDTSTICYGKTWLAYARKPEESNPLMNELREKLNQLEAEVTAESGDAAETYTNGYIWGHRNGQIELLRRILKTDEGGTIKLEGSEKP